MPAKRHATGFKQRQLRPTKMWAGKDIVHDWFDDVGVENVEVASETVGHESIQMRRFQGHAL